ncbi:MAG: hypothetical protein K5776_06850 [Lachnospiraceae bacterium]|nr:hypothetical protein [Lachnospiraceae bacterium]
MKYGESTFDILYLSFAILTGVIILIRHRNRNDVLMGTAALVLGIGDSFHLVPRVMNYFIDRDFTWYLGFGKLVTSVTMTIFYIMVFLLYKSVYAKNDKSTKDIGIVIYVLAALRIVLCLAPGNHWFTGEGTLLWAVLRNLPFIALGGIVVYLFFKVRKEDKSLGRLWLYTTLSFAFYIPVAIFASLLPMLGMLMLPKTVCYILMLVSFIKKQQKSISG